MRSACAGGSLAVKGAKAKSTTACLGGTNVTVLIFSGGAKFPDATASRNIAYDGGKFTIGNVGKVIDQLK